MVERFRRKWTSVLVLVIHLVIQQLTVSRKRTAKVKLAVVTF